MECNRIKTLLSEYLDRTLESDKSRNVKEHLLLCKDCSKEFFLMKSIAGELASLERVKAPNYLLNRINHSVRSSSWFAKFLDFIPGSGGFKLPMEFVTLATAVVLVFLIFSNIHIDKNENGMIADSGSKETVINRKSSGPFRLDFIPAVSTASGISPSDKVISVARGQASGINRDNLISGLTERVRMAGGDIVSREYARDGGYIDAITVKIPTNSYNSFIRSTERMGRFHPPAPPLTDRSSDPVLIRISLNLSE
jgi:hypothetical protein